MKKFILLMMLPFYVLSAMAQDMLVTNEGKSMTIYNLEISEQSIFFQLSDKADAPLQKMLKKDVLIIKKADGTKLDLNAPQATVASQASQPATQEESSTVYVTPETLSPETKASNDALIAKYNQPVNFSLKKRKNIGKRAQYAIGTFGIKESSILSNKDIEIGITIGSIHKDSEKKTAVYEKEEISWSNYALQFSIKNKTNRTLYIDLGNTFYISMGESCCLYVPSSTTSQASSSSGGSINLGTIADVLGVGGAAGTIANGVNVGRGATNGASSTIYAQRIVAIAPLATLNLTPQYMFGNENKQLRKDMEYHKWGIGDYLFVFIYNSDNDPFLTGEQYSYTEISSPINYSFVLSYSETEDFRITKSQSIHLYLKDLCTYRTNWAGERDCNFDTECPLNIGMEFWFKEISFPKK